MLEESQNILIQKYLANTLTEKETGLFTEHLKNETFKSELLFQAKMVDALQEADEYRLKKILKEPKGSEIKFKSEKSIVPLLSKIAAALLILVIVGFASKSLLNSNEAEKDLIAQYDTPYPPAQIQRGQDTETTFSVFSKAMPLYANENYDQALIEFRSIQNPNELNLLYQSNCLIQLKKYDEAIEILKAFTNSRDGQLQQNADWYLAISFIGKEEKGNAIAILEKIRNSKEHLFHQKAVDLLSHLE